MDFHWYFYISELLSVRVRDQSCKFKVRLAINQCNKQLKITINIDIRLKLPVKFKFQLHFLRFVHHKATHIEYCPVLYSPYSVKIILVLLRFCAFYLYLILVCWPVCVITRLSYLIASKLRATKLLQILILRIDPMPRILVTMIKFMIDLSL